MKIGLSFFPVRPQFLLPLARRADELGYESVWLGEHVVFPASIASKYPYGPELEPPLPSTPLFDPLITFAYLAGQTRRIRLATGIYLAPLRHPMILAKLVATLDALAGGRVILGLGSGWLREEFDAVDASWEHRGARMEEIIQIMRRLWAEERVAHRGRFYRFDEVGFEPKPARTVPILIGGETPAALQRAARSADGWIGMNHTPDSAGARIRELRALRGDGPFEITVQPAALLSLDEVRRFRDAGVHRIAFGARLLAAGQKTVEAAVDGINRFAETVMSRIDG